MITRWFFFWRLKNTFSYTDGCLSALSNTHCGREAKPVDKHLHEHSLYELNCSDIAFTRCCYYLDEAGGW